tara:strand:+ start:174 stop:374 length:201 start_codon:yes stop_codon:yes gene_type:complete
MEKFEEKIFWKEGLKDSDEVRGGIYFRSFDLNKFMKLVEKEEGEVVGLEFEDNNVNIIIRTNGKAE